MSEEGEGNSGDIFETTPQFMELLVFMWHLTISLSKEIVAALTT